jgi:hypothetical protein
MNKRGIALVITFVVIMVLTILGSALVTRSISESRVSQKYLQISQAFWLAEAGVNQALNDLRSNFSTTTIGPTALGAGGYQVAITANGSQRTVSSTGYVPFTGANLASRTISAVMTKVEPANFYDNAIYSASNINLNGNAYTINGDVRYATTIDSTTNISGTATQDASIAPLARLDFAQLLTIATDQNNVYEMVGSKLKNTVTESTAFPSSFWHEAGVPNVVYIKADLTLNGNFGTVSGFVVVAGDVINSPDVAQDATINGNGQIDGCIYTRGEFRINGGGGRLTVTGGVWSGEQARLNGNATVSYNATYMNAIRNMGINTSVQMLSWTDSQNPYL